MCDTYTWRPTWASGRKAAAAVHERSLVHRDAGRQLRGRMDDRGGGEHARDALHDGAAAVRVAHGGDVGVGTARADVVQRAGDPSRPRTATGSPPGTRDRRTDPRRRRPAWRRGGWRARARPGGRLRGRRLRRI